MRKLTQRFKKQLPTPTKPNLLNVGKLFSVFCFITVLLLACGKDTSSDGVIYTPPVVVAATGTLKTDSATNNCLPSNVSGIYLVGTKLNALNYLAITVNVKTKGTYSISTPSINGYYFSGTGTLSDSGLNTIKLYGIGTPIAAGVNTFAVSFGGTTCTINVTIAPVIIPTAFSFDCSAALVNGNYFGDSAVNSTNNISIPVTVSSVGSYYIATDSVNGIIFQSSGIFTTKGSQTITLAASGKPKFTGTYNYIIAKDTTTCFKTITFSHK